MIKTYRILILSLLHAVWMLALTALINASPISHWDDAEIASFFHYLKHNVFESKKSFEESEFLFIDVSSSNELVIKYDDEGKVVGNEDITNRKTLADFLAIVEKHNVHEYILCDILFESSSPNDSLLSASFEKAQRIVVSSHHKEDSLIPPKFKVPYSASDYRDQTSFFKYEMYHKDHKSTALTLAEGVEKSTIPNMFDLVKKDGKWWFNKFVVDFRIHPHHHTGSHDFSDFAEMEEQSIHLVNIEPFLEECRAEENNAAFFKKAFGNKLIVLGDFSDRNIHSTITGDLPGPLILINAYLSLKAEENQVHWLMILFLFTSYTVVSYIVFKEDDVLELFIKRRFPNSPLMIKLFEFISYFFILVITSFLTYMVWGFQLTVVWLVMYVKMVDWVISYRLSKKRAYKSS